jgi:NTE family protein
MPFLLKQVLVLCCCVPLLSMAAEPPRIGVVLGGGGARGFAHLGVLQELEKMHIPIACIAGTSAGALIGGMYANGLPLADMKRDFDMADWNAMLSGKPDRTDVPYERKNDDYKNYLDITFGLRDGKFRVPRSAVNSQDIDLFIRQLTRDRVIDSFDHLPIPFRAVATDLSNGDAVVFDRGSLATALRSSMAVPGLFDPVEDQGRLLIDGGVARNLPIEDLKRSCADRVIVVDVGTPLLATDQIRTLFDVLAQTSNLMVTRNVRQQKALLDDDDIVIRPDLSGFTTASFADNQEIIKRGAAAVKPLRARLEALAVSPDAYKTWQARLQLPASPTIHEVRVAEGSATYLNPQQLIKRLERENQGDTLASTRASLRQMFAGGDFDSLTYQVESQGGRNVVNVMPVERSVGPNYLRFGLNLKSSTSGDSSFTFLGSHLRTWLNSAGGSWRNDLQLGSDKLFHSELYQPLSVDSPVFVALQAGYKETAWPFFNAKHEKYAQLNLAETSAGLDLGVALGKYGELRTGTYWRQYTPQLNMGVLTAQDAQQDQKQHEAGWHLSAVADQFDNPRWPRKGYFFDGDVRYAVPGWGGVNSRYYSLTAEDVQTIGNVTVRMTSKLKGNLGSPDSGQYFAPQFLGGFLNMSGYQQDELYGTRAALGRVMVYWRAATLPSALGSGLYAGGSLEMGKVWRQTFSNADSNWLPGGSLFLGADTILGPFFLGVGNARGGQLIGYMFLGVDY